MIISYLGIILGYLNKGLLFLIILSTEEIGLISLIVSLGLLFAQLANLGTVYTTWKFFPFFNNPKKRHHGFLPLMLLIMTAGVAAFSLLYVVLEGTIKETYIERSPLFTTYFYWVLPIGIFYVLYLVLDVYLKSFYKNVVSVIAMDVVLRFGLTIFLMLKWFDIIDFHLFVVANSLLYIIPPVILLIYLYYLKELNLSFSSIKIPKKFQKIILQFSAYSYVNTLGMVLVNSLDIIMIAQFIGLEATGVYTIVVFLTSALQVPYRSIIRVSSPLVADHWKRREMDEMTELYRKVSSVSLLIGLISFILIWLNIDFLFTFLKPEYADGVWVFFCLMIGRLVDMYSGLNGAIFVTSKKYKYEVYFVLFLIGAVYLLNLLLIPWWGIIGAAISTSLAMILYNFGRLIFVWLQYKIHPFERNQFIVIGLAVVTLITGVLVGHLIENHWLQLVVEIALTGALFILPIYVFSLEPESISYVKNGWRFFKSKVGLTK